MMQFRFIHREQSMRDALEGVALTEQEERLVQWLARWDLLLIETLAGLFVRLRREGCCTAQDLGPDP